MILPKSSAYKSAFKKLYANKLDKLDEMNKFLKEKACNSKSSRNSKSEQI